MSDDVPETPQELVARLQTRWQATLLDVRRKYTKESWEKCQDCHRAIHDARGLADPEDA